MARVVKASKPHSLKPQWPQPANYTITSSTAPLPLLPTVEEIPVARLI